MQLWIAEYRHVYTSSARLMLFHCPTNVSSKYIANEFKKTGEYIHNLEDAGDALGMKVQYVDISYKEKKRRKAKYSYHKINAK